MSWLDKMAERCSLSFSEWNNFVKKECKSKIHEIKNGGQAEFFDE